MININSILRCFPNKMVKLIDDYFVSNNININYLEEIRLRVNKPIILKLGQVEVLIEYKLEYQEISEILQQICDNSIYSYQNQISNGYITIRGGHRVGITGNVVIKDGNVINISYISSLNFRIAKQILGASDKIIKYVINTQNNDIYSTLIVSPPGVRKDNSFKRFSKKN